MKKTREYNLALGERKQMYLMTYGFLLTEFLFLSYVRKIVNLAQIHSLVKNRRSIELKQINLNLKLLKYFFI